MFYGCTIIYLLNPLPMDIDWSQPFRFYSEAMSILCARVPVYLRDITSSAISGHKLFPILKSGVLILTLSPKKQVYLFFATPPLQRLRGTCHPSHISFQVFKYSQSSKLPPAACLLPEWSPSQLLKETEAQADARHKSSSGLAVPLSAGISFLLLFLEDKFEDATPHPGPSLLEASGDSHPLSLFRPLGGRGKAREPP